MKYTQQEQINSSRLPAAELNATPPTRMGRGRAVHAVRLPRSGRVVGVVGLVGWGHHGMPVVAWVDHEGPLLLGRAHGLRQAAAAGGSAQ
jgi:hypothetical protein